MNKSLLFIALFNLFVDIKKLIISIYNNNCICNIKTDLYDYDIQSLLCFSTILNYIAIYTHNKYYQFHLINKIFLCSIPLSSNI
jgi:hypothetical protein